MIVHALAAHADTQSDQSNIAWIILSVDNSVDLKWLL